MERKAKRRKELRVARDLQEVIFSHEIAGDKVRTYHLYADAAHYYTKALNLPGIMHPDRLRIMEKLAHSLLLNGNTTAADGFFERLTLEHGIPLSEPARLVHALLQREHGTMASEAFPLLSRAVKIAETTGDQRLCRLAQSRMADYFIRTHRYVEAAHYIEAAGEVCESDAPSVRTIYYLHKAILASAAGKTDEAFEAFEYVAQIARDEPDVLSILRAWNAYGLWARTLGDLTLFKACAENALLVAREYHLTGRIPIYCLVYAHYFLCAGQYEMAHRYVLEALLHEARSDRLAIRLARYGIPTALRVQDEETLSKCAQPVALEVAFRTGEPDQIADVTAAFIEWHVACGRRREAETLVQRVTQEVKARIHGAWRFPIVAAKYGNHSDLSRVRAMLEQEDEALVGCDLTQAHLLLFDAIVARREGQYTESQSFAQAAFDLFTKLGWHGCADVARELLPSGALVPNGAGAYSAFTHLLAVLSVRERQVAELVLQGHANRAIAQMLSIAERTVESHVTSILGHLGVRSRHQLIARFIPSRSEQGGFWVER